MSVLKYTLKKTITYVTSSAEVWYLLNDMKFIIKIYTIILTQTFIIITTYRKSVK